MPEFDSLGARQEPPEEKEVLEPMWEYDEEEEQWPKKYYTVSRKNKKLQIVC